MTLVMNARGDKLKQN